MAEVRSIDRVQRHCRPILDLGLANCFYELAIDDDMCPEHDLLLDVLDGAWLEDDGVGAGLAKDGVV